MNNAWICTENAENAETCVFVVFSILCHTLFLPLIMCVNYCLACFIQVHLPFIQVHLPVLFI